MELTLILMTSYTNISETFFENLNKFASLFFYLNWIIVLPDLPVAPKKLTAQSIARKIKKSFLQSTGQNDSVAIPDTGIQLQLVNIWN